ncbi:MAG: fumarylacetoacetate hydrolase family protein, partial [Clostridia bacterium]
ILNGDFFGELTFSGDTVLLQDVKVLTPTTPSKIVAVGLNYVNHAKELDFELPASPTLFIKASSSLCNPNDEIMLPNLSTHVDYEAELAFIIKKKAKNVKECDYKDYILGYTCFNDVSARDLQESQWMRAKSFDTFSPFGPVIETEIADLNNIEIRAIRNDSPIQRGNTRDMIFKIPFLLDYISHSMTLNVGDIITTGTPEGVGRIENGDTISIEIEGIGRLINYARNEE